MDVLIGYDAEGHAWAVDVSTPGKKLKVYKRILKYLLENGYWGREKPTFTEKSIKDLPESLQAEARKQWRDYRETLKKEHVLDPAHRTIVKEALEEGTLEEIEDFFKEGWYEIFGGKNQPSVTSVRQDFSIRFMDEEEIMEADWYGDEEAEEEDV